MILKIISLSLPMFFLCYLSKYFSQNPNLTRSLFFLAILVMFIVIKLVWESKLEQIFRNCNLYKGDDFAKRIRTEHTDEKTKYTFNLPLGLSYKHYEKLEDEISEQYGKKVSVERCKNNDPGKFIVILKDD